MRNAQVEPTRVGFGMHFRAGNCGGCNRILVQRDWHKLKPVKLPCPYCNTQVGFVIIRWPGYDRRMSTNGTLIST